MLPITLSHVTKTFGTHVAVNDVNLTIAPGGLFFLLGPAGCGKTTLLRILAGLQQPETGTLMFQEKDITTVPPQKRQTSLVFTHYALWPHLTVAAHVAYGLKISSYSKDEQAERISSTLALTGLTNYQNHLPSALSRSQQLRLALARALSINPKLLLLDEPLADMDTPMRLQMRKEIQRIQSETGITTIYATHSHEEALSMGHTIALMEKGNILQTGSPRELYHYPLNSFIAHYTGDTNLIPGTVDALVPECGLAITTALGTIYSTLNTDNFKPGAKVLCMIRPENALISTNALNTFKGTIQEVTYFGGTERYTLISNDITLSALETNAFAERPNEGESVQISFEPNQVVLIPT